MNVFSLLARHRGPLLVTQEATYSSEDVACESAKVARWLRDAGVAPGDRVMIDLKNGLTACAALFGVARFGAIAVAASAAWTPQQFEHAVADCGARALIASGSRVKQLGDRCPPAVLTEISGDGLDVIEGRDVAIIIYTSGSTAKPKGVVHSHANLVAFGEIVAGYLQNTPNDRLLWVLGWNFGYGLSQLLSMLVAGGRLIVPASMLPADIYNAHAQHRATGLAQVPFGWDQLVGFLERTGKTLDGLRYVTNAGDGPSLALLDRLERVVPGADIVLMYGQTECFRTTYLPAPQYAAKRGAMGYPIPGVTAEIVDGELWHRGALVAAGYWNDPQATARKFVDGALRTGDLVRRDDDGCLWYVGRSEAMIKSSGFRFSPQEIEAAIASHAGVRDVAVFGVDDPALGQAVEAAVVGAIEATALLGHLRPLLPRYMLPRRIHILDALPRNPNGKLSLAALRALG